MHVSLCLPQIHSMCAGFAGDELKSLQESLNKLSEAFAIDEDQESKCHSFHKIHTSDQLFL